MALCHRAEKSAGLSGREILKLNLMSAIDRFRCLELPWPRTGSLLASAQLQVVILTDCNRKLSAGLRNRYIQAYAMQNQPHLQGSDTAMH